MTMGTTKWFYMEVVLYTEVGSCKSLIVLSSKQCYTKTNSVILVRVVIIKLPKHQEVKAIEFIV